MKKKTKHETECRYGINFTKEEERAISWLQKTLKCTMESRSPTSQYAAIASEAIGRLFDNAHELHDMLHERDSELKGTNSVLKGLLGIDQSARGVTRKELS